MSLNISSSGSESKERQMCLENGHGITIEVKAYVHVYYFMEVIRQISLVTSLY